MEDVHLAREGAVMNRAPSVHVSLFLLLAGAFAATLVLVNQSWPFYSVPQIWARVFFPLRAVLVACVLTALVGLGGLVNALVQKKSLG